MTQGTATAGNLASLAHPEGSTLDLAPAGGDPRTELVTDFGLPTARAVATAGTLAGASVATTAGGFGDPVAAQITKLEVTPPEILLPKNRAASSS